MMKRLITLTALAATLSTSVNAQHVTPGIKGGLNFYTINTDNDQTYDGRTSFHLGMLGHIHLNKKWAVQPEIMYSAQGGKYTILGSEITLRLNYINVPVLLQYMFDNGFRLEAGPQFGFLAGAKTVVNDNITSIKNDINTFDFALGVGVGYLHTASGLGIDARYNFGITDINETSSVKSTNNGFQLGLFYQFHH